jgi:3-hydroxyisobutyrate dehydrogenase
MNERTTHRVAILGLGIMGSAFARRAAQAGIFVSGWDRTPERAIALAADGVHPARSPAEAAADADAVVTMVADAAAVLNVMRDQGAFGAMPSGATWAQMATIGIDGVRQAAELAADRPDITLLDAPVSGSKTAAAEGKLVVLASGERERANPAAIRLFAALASQTHWLGPVGAGTRMKLLLNAWLAVLNEGVAEVAGLADVLGVAPRQFSALVAGGALVPPWALAKLDKIAERRTNETEFPLRWAEKDVVLALDAAGDAARTRLPILNEIAKVWATALDEFGTHDLSAIYTALARRTTSVPRNEVHA